MKTEILVTLKLELGVIENLKRGVKSRIESGIDEPTLTIEDLISELVNDIYRD